MKKWLKDMLADEEGQGMVEYGLLIGLIAVLVVGAIVFLGPRIAGWFKSLDNETASIPTGT